MMMVRCELANAVQCHISFNHATTRTAHKRSRVTALVRVHGGCRGQLCACNVRSEQRWLAKATRDTAAANGAAGLSIWRCLNAAEGDEYWQSSSFLHAALQTTLRLAETQLAALHSNAPAAMPAATSPLLSALQALHKHGSADAALRKRAGLFATHAQHQIDGIITARRPLVIPTLVRAAQRKTFNPKFEMDFDAKKDYDPDRERAEYKQYQRLTNKERRGALAA